MNKENQWEDVDEHLNEDKNLNIIDVIGLVAFGLFVVAGIWQAFQPVFKYPEERRKAA